MHLDDLLHKTCLIGLSYFDADGNPIKQNQLSGTVTAVDSEQGISIALHGGQKAPGQSDAGHAPDKAPVFILPPTLSAWFVAPPGHYRDTTNGVDIKNPDFLVTWDVYRTRRETAEGQHEWWEWVPRTAPPQVNP